MRKIATMIDAYAHSITGQLGVGFKNLITGDEYYFHKDERFPSASTLKIPVLIELFHQVEQGKIALTDLHALDRQDIAPGSGVLRVLKPGVTMSIYDYAVLMMIVSDNTATDVVYNLLGRENIRGMIDRMGLRNTRSDLNCKELLCSLVGMPPETSFEEMVELFNREGTDQEIPERTEMYTDFDRPNDFSSPADMVTMLSGLYHKELISPKACEEMMQIMAECQTNGRIPYDLPQHGPNKPQAVIHKTGTLSYVANDCGIVKTSTNAYILAMFYNGIHAEPAEKEELHHHDRLLAHLSRDIFNAIHNL